MRAGGTSVRLVALLALALAWLWAWSIYTPWAADRAARLWLYDSLYYTRVVLVAWGLAEAASWAWHPARRTGIGTLALAAVAGLAALAWTLGSTAPGWRMRVLASSTPLHALAGKGLGDQRQRAGHVLVDSVRFPCGADIPWFWLGRPHGTGSGINLALVRSDTAPLAPFAPAFRVYPIADRWWLAYQHGPRYHALQPDPAAAACRPPASAGSHRAGMAFIAAG